MTYIIRNMISTRDQVLALCEISRDEWLGYRFESAFKFLKSVMQVDDFWASEIPKYHLFWDWWNTQFYRRDVDFLQNLKFDSTMMAFRIHLPGGYTSPAYVGQTALLTIHQAYTMFHKVDLYNERINNQIMHAGFHRMLRQITKPQKNKQ